MILTLVYLKLLSKGCMVPVGNNGVLVDLFDSDVVGFNVI